MILRTGLIPTALFILLALLVILSYRFESQFKHWPVFGPLISQRQEARHEAKIHKLNLYMIRDYKTLFAPSVEQDKAIYNNYIQYFQLIRDYFPDQAEGYALLGFCFARQGEKAKSFENYEKALILNPRFFWIYYDLGLLLWSTGKPTQAASLFQKAISLSPEDTISSISSSKVYMDVLSGGPAQYNAVENLKKAYERIPLFLQLLAANAPAPEISSAVEAL